MSKGLGDTIEAALSSLGISSERVERWIGKPCYCKERRDKLNSLGYWAKRVLAGKVEKALQYLNDLVEEQP